LVLGATFACGGTTPPPDARPQAPTGSTPPEETPVSRGPGDLSSEPTASSASRDQSASPHPGLQSESERGTGGADLGPPGTRLSDPQIALITESVNSAEVEQARLAQERAQDARVRQFASMMVEHHGQALKKQSKLGLEEAESPLSQQLAAESRATLEQLRKAKGADFDRAYMQAQVKGHEHALSTIENDLRPNAQHPELRAYLEDLAPQVSQHLEQARATEQAISSGTGKTSSR
jgi:putative membrane protein